MKKEELKRGWDILCEVLITDEKGEIKIRDTDKFHIAMAACTLKYIMEEIKK